MAARTGLFRAVSASEPYRPSRMAVQYYEKHSYWRSLRMRWKPKIP